MIEALEHFGTEDFLHIIEEALEFRLLGDGHCSDGLQPGRYSDKASRHQADDEFAPQLTRGCSLHKLATTDGPYHHGFDWRRPRRAWDGLRNLRRLDYLGIDQDMHVSWSLWTLLYYFSGVPQNLRCPSYNFTFRNSPERARTGPSASGGSYVCILVGPPDWRFYIFLRLL